VQDSSIWLALTAASASSTSNAPLIVDLIIVAILILINAFFAASEIAIISLNDNMVRRKAEEGDKKAIKIHRLINEPSRFLATIQVGVTLAGFLSSAFAAEKFADRLNQLIGRDIPLVNTLSVVIVTIILSFFSLVLGELVPKRLAQNNPEKLAYAVVGVITTVGVIMTPFVRLLTLSTNLVLRLLRIDPNQTDRNVTEEEIRMMVDVGHELGSIHEEEKEMIENIFDFNDTPVKECMTHRTDIISLDVDSSFEDVLEVALNEQYTRIPVFEDNIDNIIGILHVKDLLKIAANGPQEAFSLSRIIRSPYLVPASKNTDEVFREMQRDRMQMAIVIDEYGGTAGIVTIEDLLEEIVGNMQDEYDEEEAAIVQIDATTYQVDGRTPLDEVSEAIGIQLPADGFDTLAGLVISLLGKIPDEHERLTANIGTLQFKVLSMDDKRVAKVEIRVQLESEPEAAEDEA
jgi:putative hemolysin